MEQEGERMKGFCGECDRRYACDIDPDKCDEWPDPVPMTNADRIRDMTDDELNELFYEIYNAGVEDAVSYEWGQRKNSFEWTMEWLQQPAEENDNG